MFDSYSYSARPDVHVHNKIEMKPHDTADAARLYGELEQKARGAVANAVVANFGVDNEVKIVAFGTQPDHLSLSTKARMIFKINGRTFDIQCESSPFGIKRAIYETILHEVFDQALEKMSKYEKEQLLKKPSEY